MVAPSGRPRQEYPPRTFFDVTNPFPPDLSEAAK
jgi:hypothetical protein